MGQGFALRRGRRRPGPPGRSMATVRTATKRNAKLGRAGEVSADRSALALSRLGGVVVLLLPADRPRRCRGRTAPWPTTNRELRSPRERPLRQLQLPHHRGPLLPAGKRVRQGATLLRRRLRPENNPYVGLQSTRRPKPERFQERDAALQRIKERSPLNARSHRQARKEFIALADLIQLDLAHGGKGEIDLEAAAKIRAAPTARSRPTSTTSSAPTWTCTARRSGQCTTGSAAWPTAGPWAIHTYAGRGRAGRVHRLPPDDDTGQRQPEDRGITANRVTARPTTCAAPLFMTCSVRPLPPPTPAASASPPAACWSSCWPSRAASGCPSDSSGSPSTSTGSGPC